jgi:hypothetical protein
MPAIKRFHSYLPQTPATERAHQRLRFLVKNKKMSAAEIMREAFDTYFAMQPDREDIDHEIDIIFAIGSIKE